MPARLCALLCLSLSLIAAAAFAAPADPRVRPADFVDVTEVVPGVQLDIRYHTAHNFIGRPIAGYEAPKCLLTRRAAQALALVQNDLASFGLTLKIYDCYRPQRAVDDFVRWAKDPADTAARTEFYPTLDKRVLFPQGYIAERSGHSRGSTVDLTIAPLPTPAQPAWDPARQVECFKPAGVRFADNGLDMGTGFDCFHELSHARSRQVGPEQRARRALLATLMDRYGFKGLAEEWWHFTLRDEPYPDIYFDFPVR
ncbi:MAG: M15 family metallopeptidase [Thermodesulfobacteriota bacterium]